MYECNQHYNKKMLLHNSTISSISEEEQQLQQKKLSIEEELLESILLPLEYPDAKVWNEILIHGCPGVVSKYHDHLESNIKFNILI